MRKVLILFLLSIHAIAAAQTVYRTPSGKKYHRADCRSVKNASSALDMRDAVAAGLEPCKICQPNVAPVQSFAPSGSSAAGEKTTTTQCRGMTKAGARCKHRTKIANGYCFQHQPKT